MKVINLYGGPGCGKSTTAAGVFHELKVHGHNCELITEYAKDKVWEGSTNLLRNQLYVFAKQYHKLWRCLDSGVELCVTDSPLLLSLVYADYYAGTAELQPLQALFSYRKFDNLNFVLNRKKKYVGRGRNETKEQAKELDDLCRGKLREFRLPYVEIEGDQNAVNAILTYVEEEDD